jgi:hypothetical protein
MFLVNLPRFDNRLNRTTALNTNAVIRTSLVQRADLSASMHDDGMVDTATLQTTF